MSHNPIPRDLAEAALREIEYLRAELRKAKGEAGIEDRLAELAAKARGASQAPTIEDAIKRRADATSDNRRRAAKLLTGVEDTLKQVKKERGL